MSVEGKVFENEIRFKPEVAEFLKSGRGFAEFAGELFLKAHGAGMPEVGNRRLSSLLVAEYRDEAYPGGKWTIACVYLPDTLEPVDVSFEGMRLLESREVLLAHHGEIARAFEREVESAKREAWERLAAPWMEMSEAERDEEYGRARERHFGRVNREPQKVVSQWQVEKHYIEKRGFEADWKNSLPEVEASFANRMRAILDEGCCSAFADEILGTADADYLFLQWYEWGELVREKGQEIAEGCSENVALLDALDRDARDAVNVRCVFRGGETYERTIAKAALVARCKDAPGIGAFYGFEFTPRLKSGDDVGDFVGVKYRGKWLWRSSRAV